MLSKAEEVLPVDEYASITSQYLKIDLHVVAADFAEQLSSQIWQPLVEPRSERELEVLRLVAAGKTNREIAKALYLGEGTVRNYVSSILSKLGLTNRAEAAAYAVEHNLKDYL